MQERDVFLDVLAGTKHSISCYTTAIMESSNQQLRSTWQTLRNEAEQMQYQIYQMAEQKGYYMPAPQANQNDVQHVKTTLSSAVNNSTSGSSSSMNSTMGSNSGMSSSTDKNSSMSSTMGSNNSMNNTSSNNMNSSTSKSNSQMNNTKSMH